MTNQHEDAMLQENTSAASDPLPCEASASVSASGAMPLKEKSSSARQVPKDDDAEPIDDWITGVPLAIVTAAMTIVIFVMLLDTSIISTVIPSFGPL